MTVMQNWVCLVILLLGSFAGPLSPVAGPRGHLPLGKGPLVSRWSDLSGFAKPGGPVVLETRRNPLIPAGLFEIGFVW